MSAESLFSADDLERIRSTVARVEERTSGEIVPYFVERVDDHEEGRWKAASFGALVSALGAGLLFHLVGPWSDPLWWIVLPTIAGASAGFGLGSVPAIARHLLDPAAVDRRVRQRAEAAFLREEVFHTRDRTGILLFVAFFEHRALVLADSGIHRAVPLEAWTRLVDDLAAGIRAGRTTDAICRAIEEAGALLDRFGVDVRPDDVDELSDDLRVEDD